MGGCGHEQCLKSRSANLYRKFIPSELYGRGFDLKSTDYEDSENGWTNVPCWVSDPCNHCGRLPRHVESLIVAIKGAWQYGEMSHGEAAIGVYFAADSKWNTSTLLRVLDPIAEKANLLACLAALKTLLEIQSTAMMYLESVVIKTDSESLVLGMTELVFKWRANRYRNAKGLLVSNGYLYEEVNDMIAELNGRGVEVLFWHVPKSQNDEAAASANKTLLATLDREQRREMLER